MRIYSKIFSTLRFDFYQKIVEFCQEEKIADVSKVGDREFVEIWQKHWAQFEEIRTEIFNFMMTTSKSKTKFTQAEAKRIMQQAYVTYARPTEEELKEKKIS